MHETQEMWVQFLGQEDPLEKEMATHSSVLAWRIPWTEEPGGLQVLGVSQSQTRLKQLSSSSSSMSIPLGTKYRAMMCVCAKSLQSCPTLYDPMGHSPPGSSVHGIL